MALFDRSDPVRRAIALLQRERELLRGGRYADLEELVAAKHEIAAQLATAEPTRKELEALCDLARRNQRLLEAARDGIGAALARLQQLGRARQDLGTYDAAGRRHLPEGAATLRKRA